tara:strand:- start:569 stop:1042 length:474 start_codon:yes stop_codon:yes gene_type:complete
MLSPSMEVVDAFMAAATGDQTPGRITGGVLAWLETHPDIDQQHNILNQECTHTILMMAVMGSPDTTPVARREMTELLLEHGANVNAQNDIGLSALMLAALAGAEDIVRLLCSTGADVSLHAANGKTAVQAAQDAGHTEVARLMLTYLVAAHAPMDKN